MHCSLPSAFFVTTRVQRALCLFNVVAPCWGFPGLQLDRWAVIGLVSEQASPGRQSVSWVCLNRLGTL